MIALVYGTYRTILNSVRPKGIKCYHCHSENQIVVEKTIGVFHIFYVPFIPNSIKNTFSCKSCNHEFELSDLNSDLRTYYSNYKSRKLLPLWVFSGPLLIIIGFAWMTYNNMNYENELLNRLTDGHQKKIIEYKTEDGKYTTLKTIKISADSIWMRQNKLETESYKYIDQIAYPDNYDIDTTKISTKDLLSILENGEIKAIYPSGE